MNAAARWIFAAVACLVLPGAACSEPTPAERGAEVTVGLELVAVDGSSRRSFAASAPIHFRLTLHNPTASKVVLAFSSGRTRDAVVLAADGSERWRWSDGRMFTQALSELSLAAGSELAFQLVCDPSQHGADILPPGHYRAAGIIPAFGGELHSAPIEFEIRSAPELELKFD